MTNIMDKSIELTNNQVIAYLKKPASQLTKSDIIRYVMENNVRMINFMYPAEDGRIKTLNFVVNNLAYLETILSCGERVDGSSLFPSYVEAGNSDLYVLPRFSTAFIDPFSEQPTLCMLCSFFDKEGNPFSGSPECTLHRAALAFTEATGMTFEAMGELEYYVIAPDDGMFPANDQRGYHESGPYAKYNEFRKLCMEYIAQTGGQIKYGHSEVGNFKLDGMVYEQNEIEFLPNPVESAADQLTLAKWVIRNLAYRENLNITFAPKITVGKAGSGLHIHMRLMKDGRNCMTENGRLSDVARRAIGGMMVLAPSITAFGNRNPTSYFRLVPHQEAPTNVCWGDRNRSVLVRVPLGWTSGRDMCREANPLEGPSQVDTTEKQTVEMRSPDGSADLYFLMAGLCVACRYGLEQESSAEIANNTYVDGDIHSEQNRQLLERLEQLPTCCVESADWLEKQREAFEAKNVFSPRTIDGIIRTLRGMDDKGLLERLQGNKAELQKLVERYFHCG